MATFADAEHLYRCLGGLFDRLQRDEKLGPRLRKSNLVLRLEFFEPEAAITTDFASDPEEEGQYVRWFRGDGDVKAHVYLRLSGDVANRFWQGKVNLLAAIAKKDIVVSGGLHRVLPLLPALSGAFALYPDVLRELGEDELLDT